jgi:hypothetical protein
MIIPFIKLVGTETSVIGKVGQFDLCIFLVRFR